MWRYAYRTFRVRLILGPPNPRWHDDGSVVLGHLLLSRCRDNKSYADSGIMPPQGSAMLR
jgi:hypothetical protein